jgi:hypothetical protein
MDPTARAVRLLFLLLLSVPLAGCEVIGDIFQAGVWVGVILAALVVFAIVWVVSKARG